MSRPPSLGACRPSPNHELLLHALLTGDDGFAPAWRRWRSAVDFEAVDPLSLRLMPLAWRRLRDLGLDDPALARIKGVYRHTWSRNQWQLGRMAGLLALLAGGGLRTLVLKGVSLALRYFGDAGLRPMQDFDVLVPTADAERAHRLLSDAGWVWRAYAPFSKLRAEAHGGVLIDAAGAEVDLHWHVLPGCLRPADDDDFWEAAEPLSVGGQATMALSPTDQLLHVCVHGVQWSAPPPIHWVVDAMVLLRSAGGRIDWSRFVRQTRRRRLTMIVAAALRYLIETFDAPVPATVLSEILRTPIGAVERAAFEALTQPPPPSRSSWARLVLMWDRHVRACRHRHVAGRALAFAGYLSRRALQSLRGT